MVLNHVFLRTDEKGKRTFFAPEELDIVHDEAGRVTGARAKSDGLPVDYAGISTMSKSSRNGVDPQELIDHYGADTARFFIIFTSPPSKRSSGRMRASRAPTVFCAVCGISATGTKRASRLLQWSRESLTGRTKSRCCERNEPRSTAS